MVTPAPVRAAVQAVRRLLKWLFDLTSDQADPAQIDASIRAGVLYRGTNLWILVCATFVASVGLNVNSAAVIIGAMLISPLMGPILGIGYGAAVNDFGLVRKAATNMAIAMLFSILTSTVYFLLTPLHEARSEILARTSPAIWDVLIAVFGGLAGVIGSTRTEKSNVIPGVAIATALMPALCTTGYGIATLQLRFALGALYLFTINSLFIAAATLVMVRLMRLPAVAWEDPAVGVRARRWILAIVLITGVPSVYLAYGLVREEIFVGRAERFVSDAFPSEGGTVVVGNQFDSAEKTIHVTVVGESVSDDARLALEQALSTHGLRGVELRITQWQRDEVDEQALREQITGDLVKGSSRRSDDSALRIEILEQTAALLATTRTTFGEIGAELRASYPQITEVGVGMGTTWSARRSASDVLLVTIVVPEPLTEAERSRLEAWLAVRAKVAEVQLSVIVRPPPDDPSDAGPYDSE